MRSPSANRARLVSGLALAALAVTIQFPAAAGQQQAPAGCRVTGRITSVVTAPEPFGGRGGRGFPGPQGGGNAANPQAAATPATPAEPRTIALPVPGATIVVRQGERVVVVTSADASGRFSILFTPSQTFRVSAEMMAFDKVEKDITLAALPCDTTLDFELKLVPRNQLPPVAATSATTGAAASATGTGAQAGRFTQLAV